MAILGGAMLLMLGHRSATDPNNRSERSRGSHFR
jgi:hypothetical protein